MAEAVPPITTESTPSPEARRLHGLKEQAPYLGDDLTLVAIHRESVDGFVADHTTIVARERTDRIQQEWQDYRTAISKEENLSHKIQTAWYKRRTVGAVVAEGVLGGARNVEAGMRARKEIISNNNPYAMQEVRHRDTELHQITEWASARRSITQRLERARQQPCSMLAGEQVQVVLNTHDIAEQKMRQIIKDLLIDTISRQAVNGRPFPDEAIIEWFREDTRRRMTRAEHMALFGPDASTVVVADAICTVKQILQFHLAEHKIWDSEDITVVVEAAIDKSSITTATARAGAIGAVPRSIEKLTDRASLRNEYIGRALAPVTRMLGGSAVRAGVTAGLVMVAGASGLLLSTVTGGVVAPFMSAARSYNTARRDVAFNQRTIASGEDFWVDKDTHSYVQDAQPVEELFLDLQEALSGFTTKREAARLLHWIDLLHAQSNIDLIRYQPGKTDMQRSQLLQQMAQLRQQLEGDDIFVPIESIRQAFIERFGSVRGEMETYYWTRTLNAKRLGKAALFGIIGGGIAGSISVAVHEAVEAAAEITASAPVVTSIPMPIPTAMQVTPWPEREIFGPIPVPAKLEDGKLPLSDDTSLHAGKGLKLVPGAGSGLKILGKKGEVVAEDVIVDVTAKGEPSLAMRTALLQKGLVVEESPVTTVPARLEVSHQQMSTRQFMAMHEKTLSTARVATRTWPVTGEQSVFATKIRADGSVQLAARGVTSDMHHQPLRAVITLNETEESIVLPFGKNNKIILTPDHPLTQVMAKGEFASAEVAEIHPGGRFSILATSTGENFGDAHQHVTATTTHKVIEKPAEKIFILRQLAIPPTAQKVGSAQDLTLRNGGDSDDAQTQLAYDLAMPAVSLVGAAALGTVWLAYRGRHQAFLREVTYWATEISYHFQNMAQNPLARSAQEINTLLLLWQGKMASSVGRKNAARIYQATITQLGIRDLLSSKGQVHKEIADDIFAKIQAFAALKAA